jgi:hypothetical protein
VLDENFKNLKIMKKFEVTIFNPEDTKDLTEENLGYVISNFFSSETKPKIRVSVDTIEPSIQLLLLGDIKDPDYLKPRTSPDYKPRWYHITYNGDYRVEDGFNIDSYKTEVYGVHNFYTESELADWLEENYPDLKEI